MNSNEFADWQHHPITQKVFQYLKEIRQRRMDQMVNGEFTFPTADGTAMKMADVIGECNALRDVYELTFGHYANFYNLEEPVNDGTEPVGP